MTPATDRRVGLTTAAIVAAAKTIADTEGLAELTLRRIATDLGTGQASLYRHISSRTELLGLLAEDVAGDFPLIPAGSSPRRTVLRQWQAWHDHLVAHPWVPPLIAEGRQIARSAEQAAVQAIDQLRRAGLDQNDAARAYRTLWHLLLGHLLNNHPYGHSHEEGLAERHDRHDPADFRWSLERLVDGILAAAG